MKKFSIFIAFIFILINSPAQNMRLTNGSTGLQSMGDRFQYINPYDGRNIELMGERFFNDSTFRAGELKTGNNIYTTEMTYRFDQIERTVQVKFDSSGKQMFLFERDVEYFKMFVDGKTLTFEPVSVPNGRKLTMLQVVYKSPTMQLYRDVRKYVFRVKNEYNDGYGTNDVFDEIKKDYRYFFRKGKSGPYTEVKIEAKYFTSVMPSKKTQINQLFKAAQSKGGINMTKLEQLMVELDKPTL
jgi:hypothetical protein